MFRTYAQLVRLPNVFTAFADIALGAAAAGALPERWPAFLLLLLASGCLYTGGMVWNDFFDVEQDLKERPFRPIPSGRVPRRTAGWLGAGLLAAGLLFAGLAGLGEEYHARPLLLALLLAVCVLLYDGWLKRTWAGPVAMGSCRFLNVLLGLSAGAAGVAWDFHLALVIGLYIVGVTWFARTEAKLSKQSSLAGAAGVMLAALLLGLAIPTWLEPGQSSPLFPYLLVILGFWVGIPLYLAIQDPGPGRVQAAVKQSILGLVILDAVLATALVGLAGLAILLLLPPGLLLGRWIYST